MKREEAINLVTQVCVMYKGNLQEHQALQQALEVIRGLVAKDAANASHMELVDKDTTNVPPVE